MQETFTEANVTRFRSPPTDFRLCLGECLGEWEVTLLPWWIGPVIARVKELRIVRERPAYFNGQFMEAVTMKVAYEM